MTMDKVAKTNLDVTAYYRDLKKLNVEFYNQDINTSKLKFQITRNKQPMLLSDINVNSQIILVTSDGSKKVDNLTFEDEMNGVLSYTLPNDVLAHVGDVTGEIFINRKGSDDTIVVRTFKFSIKDALVNTISADTKLSYIRKFDDLEVLIKERVSEIQESIKNLDDYVTKVNNAKEDALQAIGLSKDEVELIIENGKSEIEGLLTNDTFLKVEDFDQYKTNIDNQMKDFKDNLEEKIEAKVTKEDYEKEVNDLRNQIKTYKETHHDTGWVPFNIINGGRTNPAYGYDGERNSFGCSYRVVTQGDVTTKYLRVNADSVSHNQIIAQLPEGFAKYVEVGYIRAPLKHNGTSVIIETNGEVKLYVANEDEWENSDSKYIYGEISWID